MNVYGLNARTWVRCPIPTPLHAKRRSESYSGLLIIMDHACVQLAVVHGLVWQISAFLTPWLWSLASLAYAQVAVGAVCVAASCSMMGACLCVSWGVLFDPSEVSQTLLYIATAEKDDVSSKHLFKENICNEDGDVYYKQCFVWRLNLTINLIVIYWYRMC